MAGLDQTIVVCGMGVFTGFLISHIAAFRLTSDDRILGTVQTLFCFWSAPLAAAVSILPNLILSERFLVFIFSFWIYAMASFFYVLCIFGPYATSIRLRLIRELDTPQGRTLAEINSAYNDRTILDLRLKRLLASGDVYLEGGTYKIGRANNAFFAIDGVARKLHALIRP